MVLFLYWFLSIIFIISTFSTESLEEVFFSISPPTEISVCGAPEEFSIEFLNMSGAVLTSQDIEVTFPPGIEYVPGSIQQISGHTVSEKDMADLSHPVFAVADLENGASLRFSTQQRAGKDVIEFVLEGNTVQNEVSLVSNEGDAQSVSASYNIIYPLLKLIDIRGTIQYLTKGDTASWSLNIVNAGYGNLSSFYLTDLHEPGMELISLSFGTMNATNDTIFFGPADFRRIGNGDDFFGESELIPLEKKFHISACTIESITSTLHAEWGCRNDLARDASAKLYVFIQQNMPDLAIAVNSSLSTCFASGEASPQQIHITNQGDGIAKQLELSLYKSKGYGYEEDIFSRIDSGSITLQRGKNGSLSKISPTSVLATKSSDAYACLGNNPIGQVILNLPDIEPGEEFIVSWNTYHCMVNACEASINTGWQYELDFEDICGEFLGEKKDLGEIPKQGEIEIFSEAPSDMGADKKEAFIFTISSFENSYPAGEGAHYEVAFTLPDGLDWEGDNEDLSFTNGSEWIPYSLDYVPASKVLTAKYALPAPFIIHKAELALWLKATCLSGAENERTVPLMLNINYVSDTSCSTIAPMPFSCEETLDVLLHCPKICAEGMRFDNYQIARTNFGLPDNDQDGLPDANGSIDMRAVRTNRVMVGDTVQAIYKGLSFTSLTNPTWSYGYALSEIEYGANFKVIGAEVRLYDASNTSYISCDQVGVEGKISEEDQTFIFDFSPNRLGINCSDFQGFSFAEGDSVWLTVDLVVEGNIEGDIQQIKIDNDFYLSNRENPSDTQQFQCSKWGDHLTLIGYYFANEGSRGLRIDGCSKIISQDFKLSIGTCCSNYERGELFPYEYRYWGHAKKAWTVIPENYEIVNIWVKQKRTRLSNSFVTEGIPNIQPDSVVGDTLWFDLEQYFVPYGGQLNLSDEGFSGSLEIELAPTCEVVIDEEVEIPWKFTFRKTEQLGGDVTDWFLANPDKITWNPPSLDLSTQNPTLDEMYQRLFWTLEIENTSQTADAPHAWIHTKSLNPDVEILSVIDEATGDTLELSENGDIYQLGKIEQDETKKLTLIGTYSTCESSQIEVYAGYNCSGILTDFDNFSCQYNLLTLQVEPPPAELAISIQSSDSLQDCSNDEQTLEVEFSSIQLVSIDSIALEMDFPANGGLSFIDGSAEILYPNTSSYIALPDSREVNSIVNISLLDLSQGLEPGANPIDMNTLRLRFKMQIGANYQSGDVIEFSAFFQEVCRRPLAPITTSYDPIFSFSRFPLSGLMEDIGDSWSSSWGDFDGDGYDDVYVTEFDYKRGSYLYHNQGDGTFEKWETGPQLSDIGASAGSSWGDNDNDGDLDLFVSNTARATNKLYENKGEGVFERANAGDLSSYGGRCQNAAWIDYDNDGWLDMFVSDYLPTNSNQLFHNNQDGTFTQVKGSALSSEAKFSLGATWADYDNDGYVDLFVPNGQNINNSLYHNEGNGEFTRITSGYIVIDAGNSSGSAWGDYDNDGDMDLYVCNRSKQDNFFYINNGDGTFAKDTSSIISTSGGDSNGAAWGDVNNDGWLDLFVGNDNGSLNHLYINQRDGSFQKSESPVNSDEENSMGASFADIDNDGDLDLFLANTVNKPNTLYRNNGGNCNSWKAFELEGTRSNRSGIGAKIRVKAKVYGEVMWQKREITGQSGGGTSSQSTLKAYFGLGDASIIDSVIIDWPSGLRQILSQVPIGTIEHVLERDLYERAEDVGLLNDELDNWSASWGDYNDDGYEDLYVTEYKHWKGSYLYKNEGDGTFSAITSGPEVEEKGASAGSTWGDYDNDGDLDLFVANSVHPLNPLFQNQGDGTFARVEAGDISSVGSNCQNAVWVDYDNDGWLDMFVSDLSKGKRNLLYHNQGDGTFTKVIDNNIVLEARASQGATWADYDNDGLLDLFVPNGEGENNSLYHNEGNGFFAQIKSGEIVNDGGNSVGSTWGDYDNDGDLDLYVSNSGGEANFFYINEGDGSFRKEGSKLITRNTKDSHGAGWADVNNDSYLDLLVANGAGESNDLYMNQGNGTFMESAYETSIGEEDSKGAAFADMDNDGDLDLFIANDRGEPNAFFENREDNTKNWKAFKLIGVNSNSSAIGARVNVKANIYGKPVWQIREVSGQSGGGSSSQSTLKTYFGMGNAQGIDSVVINWPSGYEQILTNISLNDIQEVVEGAGIEICGQVFFDENGNCQRDEDEKGIPNLMLEVLPGPKYVVTDLSGNYTINRQYGTHTISVVPQENWKTSDDCDSVKTVVYESATRSASLSFCSNNFPLQSTELQLDMSSYLTSNALRRGFQNTYAVSYLNKGSKEAYDVELVVEFDNEIIPLSADIPWDKIIRENLTTTYIWKLDTVAAMEQKTILVRDSVAADAALGKQVKVVSSFKGLFNDVNKENNSSTDYSPIVGAVEANSKEVYPLGVIMPTDTLTYTIQFQNIGSSFAQRVVIVDTLSEHLDESTLSVLAASHPYQISVDEHRVVSFQFDRINLPDSATNEPFSHGFTQFRILPKPETELGTEIENSATIQFDFNESIPTNLTYNRIENTQELGKMNLLEVLVSPNPMEDEARISVVGKTKRDVKVKVVRVEMFNKKGSRVYSSSDSDLGIETLPRNNLNDGLYLIRVYDVNGFIHVGKVVLR